MRQTALILCLTLAGLITLDVVVAAGLRWAEARGRLGTLVQYFDYGRSVPGKLAQWEAAPERAGNLYDVAWRTEALARSGADFAAEPADDGPVVRSYGMSFVNRILQEAQKQTADLKLDLHAAPAGTPNFTYAMFVDDRAHRRAGDIAVLGLLSSSVPGMTALSNATWSFEQPAPFTYPVFYPDSSDDGLRRIEPVVASLADQRALNPPLPRTSAWTDQLRAEDAFYSWMTFGVPMADASPFARLVRRALAKSHIADVKSDILAGAFPYAEVLRRMISDFAYTARADGQFPVVMLIQSNRPGDPDLFEITQAFLQEHNIAYLATTQYADPSDPTVFVPDGHYTQQVDVLFAQVFLDIVNAR